MPAGSTSLSERIAALQRKSSNPGANRSVSGPPTHLSPSSSPVRPTSSNSTAQNVRDRIARFQLDEKPLLPRSSFGQGGPPPGESNRVLRPYPGANAAGGGSGAWGEGVLQPQLTGGTWVSGASASNWSDANLRPQMTGGTLGKTKGGWSSPSTSPLQPHTPGAGRDAFLELDDSVSSIEATRPDNPRRGSSFSEAQMAAATAGLRRSTGRSGSNMGDGATSDAGASSVADSDVPPSTEPTSTHSSLPNLPNVPTVEVDPAVASKMAADVQQHGSSDAQDPKIQKMPTAPTDTPITPPRRSVGLADKSRSPSADVEIKVAGASPAKLDALRHSMSGTTTGCVANEQGKSSIDGNVPKPVRADEIAAARSVSNSVDSAEDRIGRLALAGEEQEGDEDQSSKSRPSSMVDPNIQGDLPTRAQVERTESGRVDPTDPHAHEVMGPGLLVPHDDIADAQSRSIAEDEKRSSLTSSNSIKREDIERYRRGERSNGDNIPGGPSSDGSLTASGSAATIGQRTIDSSMEKSPSNNAAVKAREAIALARSKSGGGSQHLRRPPPGRMMSAEEMDASDDDYEPGWASVISSSRT